jgi:hypothetical protein
MLRELVALREGSKTKRVPLIRIISKLEAKRSLKDRTMELPIIQNKRD